MTYIVQLVSYFDHEEKVKVLDLLENYQPFLDSDNPSVADWDKLSIERLVTKEAVDTSTPIKVIIDFLQSTLYEVHKGWIQLDYWDYLDNECKRVRIFQEIVLEEGQWAFTTDGESFTT